MTAPVYVIAPLETSAADRERIEAIRRAHDPQQPIVPPHVTLVFGARLATPEGVLAQAAEAAARWAPIDIVLDRAEVERSAAPGQAHVFLMPGVGETPLRALHAALHAGALAGDLNPAFAFAPHVTVAALPTAAEASALAANLNASGLSISGRLTRLDVVAFDGRTLSPLGAFSLSGPRD